MADPLSPIPTVLSTPPVATLIASVAASTITARILQDVSGVPTEIQWLANLGPSGLLIVLVWAIIVGRLRTAQEITAYNLRTERAEKVADLTTEKIDRLTEAVEKLIKDRTVVS